MSLDNSSNSTWLLSCNQWHAFNTSNDADLLDFVCPSQAARNILVDQLDLRDNMFGSLTKNIKKCKYRDANFTFNDFNDRDILMLLHVYARSLHKNFDSLSDFLEPLKHKPYVICISESHIIYQPGASPALRDRGGGGGKGFFRNPKAFSDGNHKFQRFFRPKKATSSSQKNTVGGNK